MAYIHSWRLTGAGISSRLVVSREACLIPSDEFAVNFSAHLANYFPFLHQLRTSYAMAVGHTCQLKSMNWGTLYRFQVFRIWFWLCCRRLRISSRYCEARRRAPVSEWGRRCGRPLGVISGVRVKAAVARHGAVNVLWAGFVGARFVDVRFVIVIVISRFCVWICF
jgi:hypothetical protein